MPPKKINQKAKSVGKAEEEKKEKQTKLFSKDIVEE